jgi:hypothetical protein
VEIGSTSGGIYFTRINETVETVMKDGGRKAFTSKVLINRCFVME